MKRYECMQIVRDYIPDDAVVVCSLQDTSYEWNSLRPSDLNLLRVGMGLVSPCALGIALARPDQQVIAFDADGTLTLEFGSLITLARYAPPNLTVVVFDNEAYNSAGMFPSPSANGLDIAAVAAATGLEQAIGVEEIEDFSREFKTGFASDQTAFIVAKIQRIPERVPRPRMDGRENKYRFVRAMEERNDIKVLAADDGPSFFDGPEFGGS